MSTNSMYLTDEEVILLYNALSAYHGEVCQKIAAMDAFPNVPKEAQALTTAILTLKARLDDEFSQAMKDGWQEVSDKYLRKSI